ncbi:MAG: hypothetical protein CMG74_08720 [Candidatus Marinimicrobia bacterium]|nr:hypothetical protein [Candidatus Neomarinimicrobiota bacterium]|tara:strand:+ start:45426 stop:47123 length:1698 start_codon:yes stop_codon:yes gene_type:complete
MSQKNSELIKVFEKFPDQNPNPVLRFSKEGVLMYYNESSNIIINQWEIELNQKPDQKILDNFLFLNKNKIINTFEVIARNKTYLIKAVYVDEIKCINLYGSDITAKKVMDKFPDQNPNPVMRVSREGKLTYFNKASTIIVKYYDFSLNQSIEGPLFELIGKTAITKDITQGEITVDKKSFLVYLVPVPEFDFIIIYGSDITANKLVNKFPDQNPNPVMRFNKKWKLEYFNDACDYIIENWNIGINETIPKHIITDLEKQNSTLIHNLEILIGERTYFFNIVEVFEFDFFLLYGTDITSVKDKEMILSKLSKYFSPQVYSSIFSGKLDVNITTNRKNLTVFFSDIKGFTTITEKLEPEKLTEFITHYLTQMTDIAIAYGGTVDKYIGDAIMIFFGDPTTKGLTDDAIDCVSMALKMQEKLKLIKKKWKSFGITETLDVRMGIHTDICTVGNFGSKDRLDYTVLGNGVNLASRLESSAKPNEILISDNTYNIIRKDIKCKYVGEIKVKGKAHPVKTYQVKNLILGKDEKEMIEYETDGFSLVLEKNEIKSKKKIINYLKKSIDQLKS